MTVFTFLAESPCNKTPRHLGKRQGGFLAKEGSRYELVEPKPTYIAYMGIKSTMNDWLKQPRVRYWANYLYAELFLTLRVPSLLNRRSRAVSLLVGHCVNKQLYVIGVVEETTSRTCCEDEDVQHVLVKCPEILRYLGA